MENAKKMVGWMAEPRSAFFAEVYFHQTVGTEGFRRVKHSSSQLLFWPYFAAQRETRKKSN